MFEFLRERPDPTLAPVPVLHERLDSETIDHIIAEHNDEIDKLVASIRGISNKLSCCFEPYNDEEQALSRTKEQNQLRVSFLQREVVRLQEQARHLKLNDDLVFISRQVDDLNKEVSTLHSALQTKEISYKRELISLSNQQTFKLQELAAAKAEQQRLELLLRKQAS